MISHFRVIAIFLLVGGCIGTDDVLVFAMGSDEHTGIGKDILEGFHAVHEHIAGAGAHEELHATDVLLVQFSQIIRIVVRRSEVEGIVHDALGGGILELVFQSFEGCGLRIGVRHVHVAGHASGCCCHAFSVHVGLVCQARVTEMYMVIDDTREEIASLGIDGFITWSGWFFALLQHFGYHFVFYHDGTTEGLSFVHDPCVVDVCSFHDDYAFCGYLRNQLLHFNCITPKKASPKMLLFILDVPNSRLTKMTGTSAILNPHW